MNFKYTICLLSVLGIFTQGSMAQQIIARAEATPSVVMVGESANYTVLFINARSAPNMNTPRVAGLDFSSTPGASTMQRILNGRITLEVKLTWSFRPTRTGSFVIPGRVIDFNGQDVQIPPVEIKAVPKSEEARSRAFLNLQLPKAPYYVGQALPARLSLYIRQDLSVANIEFPDLLGDFFIHSEFSNNPKRLAVESQGRPYEVLAWDIIITPIKTGSADLTFSQNIVVQIPVSDGRFPSIFSVRQTRTEPYNLRTDSQEIEITPLPEEGKRDSFRDAIGEFEVSVALSSRELMVGEPITVTLTLDGKGNFSRISPPELPDWENWRFYPPKVNFEPRDERGYQGKKSFEYILIPQSEEITEIPELAYSIFDPQSGTYKNTILEAEAVTVSPSLNPVETDFSMPSFGTKSETGIKVPESILSLRPNPGTLLPSSSQYWKNTEFWLANGVTALAILLLAWWQNRRLRLRTDNHLARRYEGGRKVRKMMQKAALGSRNKDPDAFFQAARYCIAECISHLSRTAPDAQTMVTSDCLDILREAESPEHVLLRTATILDAADAHQFASVTPNIGRLKGLHSELSTLIPELNRLKK